MEKPLSDSEKIQLFDQLKMIGDDGQYFKAITALKLLRDDVLKLESDECGCCVDDFRISGNEVLGLIDDMIGENE